MLTQQQELFIMFQSHFQSVLRRLKNLRRFRGDHEAGLAAVLVSITSRDLPRQMGFDQFSRMNLEPTREEELLMKIM